MQFINTSVNLSTLCTDMKVLIYHFLILIFLGKITGLELIWILGDEFVDRSYVEHMQHATNANRERPYLFENYEVSHYSTTRYSSNIRNILGRLRMLTCKAMKEHTTLPKAIVYVFEDHLI